MKEKMSNQIDDKQEISLTKSEAANLLWEEWKYRHEVFWNSLYRWGIATVSVTIVPYLMPDLIKKLGFAILVFPFMAFLLSLFAAWHMAAEYARLLPVTKKYKSLLGKNNPDGIPSDTFINQIIKIPIGWAVSLVFLFFAIVVEFLNILVLLWLLIQK